MKKRGGLFKQKNYKEIILSNKKTQKSPSYKMFRDLQPFEGKEIIITFKFITSFMTAIIKIKKLKYSKIIPEIICTEKSALRNVHFNHIRFKNILQYSTNPSEILISKLDWE